MRSIAAAAALLCALAPAAAPPDRSAEVLKHLEQTIAWYRNTSAVERSAALQNDVLLRETARRTSAQALQRAFAFARAEAALRGADPARTSAPSAEPGRNMERAAARARERVAMLELRLSELDDAAAKAPAAARAAQAARRKQIVAELNLARQIEDSIKALVAFAGAAGAAGGGLSGRIDQLERSVPEALRASQPAAPAPAAGSAPSFHPESAGVFGLATELFTLARARTHLNHLIEETDALLKSAGERRAPLSAELRAAIRRSDEIEAASASGDPELVEIARREIESLSARYKRLSAALTPLREHAILVETSRGNLAEWRNTVDARYGSVGGYLLMRSLILGLAICALLVVSELWRRVAFRYARDPRRRRQFLVLRRVVVGCAIAVIIIIGFISEVGSLATYAGFLTAGVALALQGPILSVVAYFFLIGRYGLRVGDRVTISGVTGDVVEIGLVRTHIMELAGKGTDLRPTGRVVTFSNSVLFQPAALFKQMPGTDYVWRTVTLTLAAECDAQSAEKKLMQAVEAVYEDYRHTIEQQHAAFERAVDMKIPAPHPRGRVRLTETGLEFSVHYPVESRRVAAVDERVLRALQETVANEPALALARSGEPRLLELV